MGSTSVDRARSRAAGIARRGAVPRTGRSLPLALLFLGVTIATGSISEILINGKVVKDPGLEREFVRFLIGNLSVLSLCHLVGAVGAGLSLIWSLASDATGWTGSSRRTWMWLLLLAISLGGAASLLPLPPAWQSVIHFRVVLVLLVIGGFRLSMEHGESGGEEPVLSNPPVLPDAIVIPSLAWFLDGGLLVGTILGGVDSCMLLWAKGGWLGPIEGTMAIAMLLTCHVLYASCLSAGLWAAFRGLAAADRAMGGWGLVHDRDVLRGCLAALCATVLFHVVLYYTTSSEAADLRYVPMPMDGDVWFFIAAALLATICLAEWRRPTKAARHAQK